MTHSNPTQKPVKRNDLFNGFTLFVLIAGILSVGINMINGRFHPGDFRVYYTAAGNLLSGDPVYLQSFYEGSGFFKYCPASLFFFLPFTLFGYQAASLIQALIQVVSCWYTFVLIRRIIVQHILGHGLRHEILLLSGSFSCILIQFARETYLGNINLVLLMLCCRSLLDFLEGKGIRGGFLLGLACLLKPYLLVMALPLLLRRKRGALISLALTGGAGLLLPFLYPGPGAGMELYRGWISTLLNHSELFPGRTSLDYLVSLLIPAWPGWGAGVILILCLSAVSALILADTRREKTHPAVAGRHLASEWFLLLALLPNLIRTDWVVMLLATPAIAFILFDIAAEKKYRLIPLFLAILFFYGANSDDLLGRQLSHRILEAGLMGLANFLFAVMALWLFLARRQPPP